MIKVPVRCKTFDAYIKEMIYHPERAKKWLADKRLTLHEKKILQGYLLIRDNQNTKVIKELLPLAPSDIDFVRSHWELLLGISYNNIGNFILAEKYLRSAIKDFEEKQELHHLFTALFNYMNLLSNTGKIQAMHKVIRKMEDLNPDGKLSQIRLLRSQFIYACDISDHQKATDLIQKINKIKSEMSESDLIQHLVCEFMFHVKFEELHSAKDTLEQMKKYRKFMLSENFNFMKRLLAHLTEDATIYAYEREFSSLPILFHQIKVIESLQSKELDEANKHWKELQKIAPDVHLEELKYAGEKCLFSLCLDKHLKQKIEDPFYAVSGEGSKIDKAYEILQNLKEPIKKAHLFELLWGEEPESKEDLVRLSNLISKMRRHYGVEVISRKGTYLLASEERKVSKSS